MIKENINRRENIMKLAIALVVILLVIFGIRLFLSQNNDTHSPNKQTAFSLEELKPSRISYPAGWQEASSVVVGSEKAGIISEATRSNPTVTVSVRTVDGPLASGFDIQKIPDEVVAKLKGSLDNFTLKDQSIVKTGSRDTVKIVYVAPESSDDETISTMYIVPLASKTYYITYHTSEDLTKVSSDVTAINLSVVNL